MFSLRSSFFLLFSLKSNLFLHQNNELGVGFQTARSVKTLKCIQVHAQELFETSCCCCCPCCWLRQWRLPDYLFVFIISGSQQQHLNWTANPHVSFSKVGGVVQSII